MPISVTCTNPDCKQACTVPDDHAGRIVRCPKCPAVIHVPLYPELEQLVGQGSSENFDLDLNEFQFASDSSDAKPPQSTAKPPPPPGMPPPPQVDFFVAMMGFFRRSGLGKASVIVLAVGLGCIVLLLLSILMPWQTSRGSDFSSNYTIGIATISGSLSFFLSLGVIAFLVTVVAARQSFLFEFALWTFVGWSALSTLWRVIDIITFHGAGFGLYLALLASLGAVGTSGFVVFQRLLNAKR